MAAKTTGLDMKRNYASVTLYDFIGLTLCYRMTDFSIYVSCLISFYRATLC